MKWGVSEIGPGFLEHWNTGPLVLISNVSVSYLAWFGSVRLNGDFGFIFYLLLPPDPIQGSSCRKLVPFSFHSIQFTPSPSSTSQPSAKPPPSQ